MACGLSPLTESRLIIEDSLNLWRVDRRLLQVVHEFDRSLFMVRGGFKRSSGFIKGFTRLCPFFRGLIEAPPWWVRVLCV